MSEENKFFSDNDSSNNDESTNTSPSANDDAKIKEDFDTVYFANEENDNCSTEAKPPKKDKRRISIKTFVLSLIAAMLVATILTYSISHAVYRSAYADAYADANRPTDIDDIDIIGEIIEENYYGDVDSEKFMQEAIKAYVAQTGDRYAAYYTQEELNAMQTEDAGKMVGIGVSITNTTVSYGGKEVKVLKVVNVFPESPAEESGVKVGDYIYSAIIEDKTLTVDELGYDETLNKLLGEEGTTASFIVLRHDGEALSEKRFDIVRKNIISRSVYYRIPKLDLNNDKKIGVVQITKFDYTTPTQFCEAVESLKEQGCTKFIMDVRNNPGGYQMSVGAVLSYFLNEGDVYIRTKDKQGNIESDTVQVVTKYTGDAAGCNVSKEDIGKYQDLDMVVLCNESTASAGELFVATFKDYDSDYGLGKVVGNTTFGKGKLQTTYYLQSYAFSKYKVLDIDGAVKITTHEYFSAKSGSYDGIGIEPNEKVQLSKEALSYNVYDYEKLDPIDDQLLKAINILNKQGE